jgi:hypothetical protein
MGRKYTKRTWTVEHSWNCGHCGHSNAGRNDECSNCGKPIDGTHKEHVPTDTSFSNRVTDTNKFDDKRPDWFCSYCSARNPASRTDCKQCGALQGSKKGNAASGQETTTGGAVLDPVKGTTAPSSMPSLSGSFKYPRDKNGEPSHFEEFHSSSAEPEVIKNPNYQSADPVSVPPVPKDGASSYNPLESPKPTATAKPGMGYRDVVFEEPKMPTAWENFKTSISNNLKGFAMVGGIGMAIFGIIWLCIWLFTWHDTTARIQETHWHWHVALHQRGIYHGHDWRDQEHAHAYNESCSTQIRSYHQCNPHDCNPHNVTYDCRCHSVETCHPVEHCHNVCTNSGNRSSSCSEECEEDNECSSHQECDTCNRTEYDTCYDQCPDFDQMCDYDYPAWPEINHADDTRTDHTLVRPNLNAVGNQVCPGDPEELNIQNPSITQCTVDSVDFQVLFDGGETAGHWAETPNSLSEYDRFRMGATWNVQYNHAGMHRLINPR